MVYWKKVHSAKSKSKEKPTPLEPRHTKHFQTVRAAECSTRVKLSFKWLCFPLLEGNVVMKMRYLAKSKFVHDGVVPEAGLRVVGMKNDVRINKKRQEDHGTKGDLISKQFFFLGTYDLKRRKSEQRGKPTENSSTSAN